MRVVFIFLLFINSAFGQGYNSNWIVGYDSNNGLPYGTTKIEITNSTITTINYPVEMSFGITLGTICDSNGNILLYSNGTYIANMQNDSMVNGTGLNPSIYTSSVGSYGLNIPQANLVLPFLGNSNKYYLFHSTFDDDATEVLTKNIYYSVVDISLDSGRGAVIDKNHVLINGRFNTGRLIACKHANGRDWWLFAHGFQNNKIYRWFISPSGISGPTIQNWMIDRDNWAGAFIFSPDGSKAVYHGNAQGTEIYDFDRCLGIFSNGIFIPSNDSSGVGGCAISPNSQYLYINTYDSLWQYDLTSSNIAASELFIDVYNGDIDSITGWLPTNFNFMFLAADGKIYMATGNSTRYYHVINAPDSGGLSCNFVQKGLQIPALKYITVPNFPNYYLGADTNSICDSLSHIGLEEKEKIVMAVFPNPVSSGGVSLQYKTITQEGKIDLYDRDGRLVKQYYVSPYTSMYHLKLPAIKSGMYLLRMESGGRAGSHKVVVE
jgi:hypothetical protein